MKIQVIGHSKSGKSIKVAQVTELFGKQAIGQAGNVLMADPDDLPAIGTQMDVKSVDFSRTWEVTNETTGVVSSGFWADITV